MNLESALNYLSEPEIETKNGIQALINKLELIKQKPCDRQLEAIRLFANKLAYIDSLEKHIPRYIRYEKSNGYWIGKRAYLGRKFAKSSRDRELVIQSYKDWCNQHGIAA